MTVFSKSLIRWIKDLPASPRKIDILFYNAVRFGMTYQDPGAAAYQERSYDRKLVTV